jgi:hypothetical protein
MQGHRHKSAFVEIRITRVQGREDTRVIAQRIARMAGGEEVYLFDEAFMKACGIVASVAHQSVN